MLDEARDAILASDRTRALSVLLDAWRASRSPRVADVIDRISAIVMRSRGGGDAVRSQVAWLDLEAQGESLDIPVLLDAKWPTTTKLWAPRMDRLCGRPDDPRIAMFLAHLVERPDVMLVGSRIVDVTIKRIGTSGDVRALPILKRIAAQDKDDPVLAAACRALAKVEQKVKDANRQLNAVDAKLLDEIEQLSRSTSGGSQVWDERDLILGIVRDPTDEGARAVYADALLERGGARAELVELEVAQRGKGGKLDKKQMERRRALLTEHGAEWAGPLDEWLEPEHRRFEGGVLVAGMLATSALKDLKRALAEPTWPIVRDIELPQAMSAPQLAELLRHPNMAHLRGLYGVAPAALAKLDPSATVPPIEVLGIRQVRERLAPILGELSSFRSVRKLVIDRRTAQILSEWDALGSSLFLRRLSELEILARGDLMEWKERLSKTKVETFIMNLAVEGPSYAACSGWRVVFALKERKLTATWLDSDTPQKPSIEGLYDVLREAQDEQPSDFMDVDVQIECPCLQLPARERAGIDELVLCLREGREAPWRPR